MDSLEQLMQLPQALAAFEINERGELQRHRIADDTAFDASALDLLAHMCVANIAIATMQARGWEALSDSRGFYPIEGFTLVGMDWSAVTDGRRGVVLHNEDADYQAAYDRLAQLQEAA